MDTELQTFIGAIGGGVLDRLVDRSNQMFQNDRNCRGYADCVRGHNRWLLNYEVLLVL